MHTGGETATAFAENATTGMQIHFNVWPGDASFGGNFDAASLPVHQYISWVQYSSYADGVFNFEWREDFATGALPSGWSIGNWPSPKSLSTHAPVNVGFVADLAVLSLTDDAATGFTGAAPVDDDAASPAAGAAGATGAAGAGGAGTGAVSGEPSPAPASPAGGNGGSGGPTGGAGNSAGTPSAMPPAPAGAGGGQMLSNPSERASSDGQCSYGAAAAPRCRDAICGLALGLITLLAARRRRQYPRSALNAALREQCDSRHSSAVCPGSMPAASP